MDTNGRRTDIRGPLPAFPRTGADISGRYSAKDAGSVTV